MSPNRIYPGRDAPASVSRPAMRSDQPDIRDRKLGDEWQAWDGEIIQPAEIRVGNRLFLSLLLFSILIIIDAAFFFLYLISPRLTQLSPSAPLYVGLCFALVSLLVLFWYAAVLVLLTTSNKRFCFCIGNGFFFELSTVASRIGRRLGISRDKVGHSFIQVSNALTLASLKAKKERRVLVLLPRCLAKEARERILEEVKKFNPDAVVGIACERDLVLGIRDVSSKIPVFGIPNIRPQGPCKGTHIEYDELEYTLRFLCDSVS
ncbi:MAG: DUF116 domain-containing protein [Chitinivibrionia bacterium]|nr:DUF116 domain-containing protein [Chitinivibrionia bacterium]